MLSREKSILCVAFYFNENSNQHSDTVLQQREVKLIVEQVLPYKNDARHDALFHSKAFMFHRLCALLTFNLVCANLKVSLLLHAVCCMMFQAIKIETFHDE